MLEKLHVVAEKEVSRRVEQAKDIYSDSVCSIYGVSNSRDWPHLGSATLVSWKTQVWLITARHLLESGRQASDFIAVSEKCVQPVSLSRRFIKSDEERDLALCAINPNELVALSATPVNGIDFFKFPVAVSGRAIGTIGWPNTKNKLDRYKQTMITQMIVSGPQRAADSVGFEQEHDDHYVYQRYHEKDAIDSNQKHLNPPKLVGLSGGLTFDLGNPIDPEILAGNTEYSPHPIGICTKYDPLRRVIRSTRPGTFLQEFIESGVILDC